MGRLGSFVTVIGAVATSGSVLAGSVVSAGCVTCAGNSGAGEGKASEGANFCGGLQAGTGHNQNGVGKGMGWGMPCGKAGQVGGADHIVMTGQNRGGNV
jgi:hypothetical protein